MARYGVLTDIHGNVEALEAALNELDRRGVSTLLCMGDLVGFNADSSSVVRLLQSRNAVAIAGNHDLIAIEKMGLEKCGHRAAHALKRTRTTLPSDLRAVLAALPLHAVIENWILLVHGDEGDPQAYVRSTIDVEISARRVRVRHPQVRVVLHGHTHERRIHRVDAAGSARREAPRVDSGIVSLRTEVGEILSINPGSVDGQRKPPGERIAELGILDTDRQEMQLLAVQYDDARTEARARAGGYRPSRAHDLLHTSRRLIGRVF